MKKVLILLISVLIVLTISCSDKNGGDSSSGFPTIPDDFDGEWPELGINTLLFIWQWELGKESFVEVGIQYYNEEIPQNCELKFDNTTILVADSSDWYCWYNDSLGMYENYLWIDSEDFPELGDIQSGQTIDYYLRINTTTNSGSLKIPYQVYGNFPVFNVEENYHFEWSIQQNPDLHYIFFYIEDYCRDEDLYKYWQLTGSKREYTITKSIYQNFVGIDELYVGIEVDAITYSRKGSFLAFSDKYDYYEEGWKTDTSFDRELHRKRLIKALLNDLGSE